MLGVDAGAIAVFHLSFPHSHRPHDRGKIQIQVDPLEEIIAAAACHVIHHRSPGADAHAQIGRRHRDELGLALGRATGDGPTHRLFGEEQAHLAGHHPLDERLDILISGNRKSTPIVVKGLDFGCAILFAVSRLGIALQEILEHLALSLGRIVHSIVPGLQEGVEHLCRCLGINVVHGGSPDEKSSVSLGLECITLAV